MLQSIIRRNLFTVQLFGRKDIKNYLHISACLSNHDENSNSSYDSNQDNKVKNLLENSAAFIETQPIDSEDKWTTLPYAEGTLMTREDKHELGVARQKIDPRDTSIILFPGQGAQFVGMAKSLVNVPVAKDVFDYASEILNYDLFKLCNEGPKNQLNDIRYSHVAIMVTSLANLEVLREERPDTVLNCVATAGFSLGEFTALVFSGALQFDDALQLVQVRAEAIHAASEMCKGGMASIVFGPDSNVIEACKAAKVWCLNNNIEKPECLISNYMYPKYKILSGNDEALEYLKSNVNQFRLRGLHRIKNAPAAHSRLMEPTVEPIKEALKLINISDPIIRIYSNITGKPYASANHIKKLLPQQLIKPLRWEQTMHNIYARRQGEYYPRTVVCGPNMALQQILRNVNLKAFHQSLHIGDVNPKKIRKKN